MNKDNEKYNIEEEGFYIVGGESEARNRIVPWWLWVIIGVILLVGNIFFSIKFSVSHIVTENKNISAPIPDSKEPNNIWYNNIDSSLPSCIAEREIVVDSICLKILTPYNVTPELHLGQIDTTDSRILFAAWAADIRRDNGKIVGAFVLDGEPLSWGLSKRGYCAIFDDEITFGVADNSPLFEQATEQGGDFFRQYASVDNGIMVTNNPENRSFRRALCALNGEVCIIVSTDRVLMNDFSNILVKLGVDNAIFLVGGTEDGWYRKDDGTICRLGKKYEKDNPNISYLVFRAQ